jgi:hypothetical protein
MNFHLCVQTGVIVEVSKEFLAAERLFVDRTRPLLLWLLATSELEVREHCVVCSRVARDINCTASRLTHQWHTLRLDKVSLRVDFTS